MNAIRAWMGGLTMLGQYCLYKWGLSKRFPTIEGRYEEIQHLVGQFTGWNRYIRVRNEGFVPVGHAAIYYGPHGKLDDPLFMFRAAQLASGGQVELRAMQRDDFFAGTPLKTRVFDADEFLSSFGTFGIHREKPTLKQLKVFTGLLESGKSFILFPGRTRSRSGLLMEYRDGFQEPGGISFFLHHMQRSRPGMTVSAVPACRSYNPVTRHSVVIFGPEQFLEPGADRSAQRAFDAHLVEHMSRFVEVCAVQILSVFLYLQVLHSRENFLAVDSLVDGVTTMFGNSAYPYYDEEEQANLPHAVVLALEHLQREGMLARKGRNVKLDRMRIAAAPPLTGKFRRHNAVKYHVNQVLHLDDVIAEAGHVWAGLERG